MARQNPTRTLKTWTAERELAKRHADRVKALAAQQQGTLPVGTPTSSPIMTYVIIGAAVIGLVFFLKRKKASA